FLFFFSSRRRHTRSKRDWSSDVCSSDLDELRHLTRSTVNLETEGDVTHMASVNGVLDFEQKDNQATFSADNQHLSDILSEASKLGVKKFESAPPTLEDLFMRHYEG